MRWLIVVLALAMAGCMDTAPGEPAQGSNGAGNGGDMGDAMDDRDLSTYGVNGDPFVGDANASVQVVSYEAPGCANCRFYHFNHLPGVLADFADTGKIGYHFLQYQVGYTYDISGGVAAECAFREGGTEAYEHIMDLIFGEQKASKLPEYLDATAAEFGLDAEALQSCYEAEETKSEVFADIHGGSTSGAGSNPGFAIISDKGVEIVKGSSGPRAAIERALA